MVHSEDCSASDFNLHSKLIYIKKAIILIVRYICFALSNWNLTYGLVRLLATRSVIWPQYFITLAQELWNMVCSLFGVHWVMPPGVVTFNYLPDMLDFFTSIVIQILFSVASQHNACVPCFLCIFLNQFSIKFITDKKKYFISLNH